MIRLLLCATLMCATSAWADKADDSFAEVDSVVTNRKELKTDYAVTIKKATIFSSFLDEGKLIATADDMYVLIDVPLLNAKGTKLDSLNTFMSTGQKSGYDGRPVYVTAEGSMVSGRLYMRYDKAIRFLKDMNGGK